MVSACTSGVLNVTGASLSAVAGRSACGVASLICGAVGEEFAQGLARSSLLLDGHTTLLLGRSGLQLAAEWDTSMQVLRGAGGQTGRAGGTGQTPARWLRS